MTIKVTVGGARGAPGYKGDPGGNAMAVGLFTGIVGLTIPAGTNAIRTTGYSVVGVGGAFYKSTTNTGATFYRTQSADGQWWELAEPYPTVDQLNGVATNALSYGSVVRVADGESLTFSSLNLGSGQRVRGAALSTSLTSGAAVNMASGAVDVIIADSVFTGNPSNYINVNNPNVEGLRFINNRVTTTGYGVLDNSGAGGSDFAIYAFNEINAEADPIAFNHPAVTVSRRLALGNLLDVIPGGSGGSAGFAISVANTDDYIIVGNFVRESRLEAFHVEDGQSRGIIGFNTGTGLLGDGVHILAPSVSQGTADPLIVVGNHLNHTGTKSAFSGHIAVSDSDGTLALNIFDDFVVNGFGTGLSIGQQTEAYGLGVVLNANTALAAGVNGQGFGTLYCSNTAALFLGGAGAHAGTFISITVPTTILAKQGASFPGPSAERFRFPFSYSHTGNSTIQAFNICTMPSLFAGRVVIATATHSNDSIFYVGEITWDGTTLTLLNGVVKYNGAFSSASLAVTAGVLQFKFFSSAARSGLASADFGCPAIWYQN